MTKERINISIDKEVLETAKKHIPNLSNFLEECLKHYLGYIDGTFPVGNVQDINDKIGKLQAELFLINENYDVEDSKRKAEEFERNKAWRFLWNDYYRTLVPDKDLLQKAVEVLGVKEDTLEDLLDEVYEAKDKLDTEEWGTVKEWYDKVMTND